MRACWGPQAGSSFSFPAATSRAATRGQADGACGQLLTGPLAGAVQGSWRSLTHSADAAASVCLKPSFPQAVCLGLHLIFSAQASPASAPSRSSCCPAAASRPTILTVLSLPLLRVLLPWAGPLPTHALLPSRGTCCLLCQGMCCPLASQSECAAQPLPPVPLSLPTSSLQSCLTLPGPWTHLGCCPGPCPRLDTVPGCPLQSCSAPGPSRLLLHFGSPTPQAFPFGPPCCPPCPQQEPHLFIQAGTESHAPSRVASRSVLLEGLTVTHLA